MARANDKVDRQLLALLQANARESTTALASKLGIARTTVQERIQRLETNGTICGYAAILSHDPFEGYTQALLLLGLAPKSLRSVIGRLALFPEIKLCQQMSGDYDVCCRIAVPHVEDLGAVVDEVSEIAGVERIKSWVALTTHFDRLERDLTAIAAHRGAISDGEGG